MRRRFHLGPRCLYLSLFECIQAVPHVHTLNVRLAMPLLVARKPVFCIYYIELSHIQVARFAINLSRMRIEKRWSDCADEQAVSVSEITPGVSCVDVHIGAQSILKLHTL